MTEETTQSSLLGKIAAYTEILQKDPRSTIFVSLSEAYRKLGHFEDARRIVEEGLQIHPDFSPGYVVLARILCQQGDLDSSAAMFSRALQLDEKSLAALVGYARLTALSEDYDKTRELLLTARNLSPADPVINKFLNSLPADSDEQEQSTEKFSVPLVSETLADLYMKQGQPKKALEILQELLSNDPDNLKLRRLIRDAELQIEGGEPADATPVAEVSAADQGAETSEESVAEESTEALFADSIEIENEIEAEPETADIPAPVTTEEPTAEPLAEESSDAATGVVASPAPAAAEIDAATDTTPLATLRRWLENIQKRRANV